MSANEIVKAPPATSAAEGREKRFYRSELDILRFFAFLLVFIDHAFPLNAQTYTIGHLHFPQSVALWLTAFVSSGGLGVDLFFTLSAYLITELLIRERERFGHINLRDFYIRRCLRIYPLYYGFLAIILIINKVFVVGGYLSSGYKLLFLLPLGNWACVMWGFPPSVANHLWSISIEEQFYFIYPLLLRIFDIRRIVLMAVIMFGIANLMRLVLVMSGASHSAIWCNTLARLDPLVCGALAAVWLRGGAPRLTQLQRIILGGTGLFLLVACSRFASPAGISSLVFYPVAAAGAILILMSSLMPKSLPRNYLTNTLIYLGRISYGLYVWHTLSLDLSERWKFGGRYSIQLATKVIMGFILTAAFSVASYELYESYFLKLKERFTLIPSRPV